MKEDTSSTAKWVNEMGKSIKKGEENSRNVAQAFEEIANSYSKTLDISEKIVSATKQQTQDIGDIKSITEGIVVIAEQTAAGSEEVAASSSELSTGMTTFTVKSQQVMDTINDLKNKLGMFKLK